MKTSRKTDYAVHALMILARNKGQELSVKELADLENVSSSYLAKVMQKLSTAGIVSSSEGKKGGYTLAKDADKINLAQIMQIFEAKDNIFECVDNIHGCSIIDRCKIHRVFGRAYQKMLAELEQITIKDIIDPEIK
ncbi:Rrf2 family protein [Halanaerobium congolense]|uniref:Rrf2 family protein n=1 Tax=Halanaerobium congolense TaxID=54121 RepID=A0A1I0CBX5_9FIRM|nr:Rrf2 family transcriptional regulator [Halanaerobium congolense]PTX17713.1 BadM/Rrf2 family transcriptional regulator [Halanaerobium congolense]SDF96807.1 Rrf2 family protein [Halanaerobium congolense]SET16498.1 Rrf2 family protein [Halanaerobium congolense]SFP63952.1 Rrf2 family protein [Halanaerobium congolense]